MPSAPLVIVNPVAGGGRAGRRLEWLRHRLAGNEGARLVVTSRAGEAETIAAESDSGGHDRVVAVGGDGTVQEVVNGLMAGGSRAALGIVPLGSGNDLARSLGLPRDLGRSVDAALGDAETWIDLLHATNGDGRARWFASAGGVGFDAQVAEAMSRHRTRNPGRAGYLVTTFRELRRFENRRLGITLDGRRSERDVLFLAVANGPYYGGGMHVAPGASLDDGRFDLCIVGDISRLTAVRQLANLYRGTHIRHPQVDVARGAHLVVDSAVATRIHLDGEPFGSLPLEVRAHGGRMRVAHPGA